MRTAIGRAALLCATLACAAPGAGTVVYRNDFQAPPGTAYPEWTTSGYTWTANLAGTVPAGGRPQTVTNTEAPGGQRFLGEFGGAALVTARPYDAQHFVRVDQTVTLTLRGLPEHSTAAVEFDLLVLKSWDGNSPMYGPDRWKLAVAGGPTLLETTFSNNFKTAKEGSFQDYPAPAATPRTGAAATGTLGYTFFGDAIYHFVFRFPHRDGTLALEFASSLFEGKGTDDESWGLDNVEVRVDTPAGSPLNTKAKLGFHLKRAFGPAAGLGAATSAALAQWADSPPEWRQGWEAYGKRTGNALGAGSMRAGMVFALDAVLRLDPRFVRSSHTAASRRIGDALAQTVVARTGGGRRVPGIARVSSAFGAAFLSRKLWYPDSHNGTGWCVATGGITLAADAGMNVFREFWPNLRSRLRRR